jgi:hypothetical protein
MTNPLSILDYRRPVEFRIGDVLLRSWSVLSRNLPTFLVLSGIASLLPLLLQLFGPARPAGRSFTWTDAVATLLDMVLSAFAQAIVVYAAFQDLRGRNVSPMESLSRGLARLLPVLGLSILVALAVGFGIVAFVIPGLIAIASLAVALPACVVERSGPFLSLSRSSDLTRGYRWPILGVAIALIIIGMIGDALIGAALSSTNALTITLATWAWTTFAQSFQSVYAAILYHDLRAVKEGIGIEEIAAVFD